MAAGAGVPGGLGGRGRPREAGRIESATVENDQIRLDRRYLRALISNLKESLMPPLRYYNLFISHVWRSDHNSEYYRLKALLNSSPYFWWRDYSVPEHDPFETKTNFQLDGKLVEQIRQVSCFIAVAGMYVNHRRWIQREIEVASSFRKPIIAVIPWGQLRVPAELQQRATELVAWNSTSLVDAIRRRSL